MESIEYVRHIADDKYGNLWVGTFMHGLYCIDNGGKITSYTKENSCLYTNTITDLVYSSDHAMLYIGTSTGLYELNTQTQQLAPVKGNDNEVSLIKCILVAYTVINGDCCGLEPDMEFEFMMKK